MVREGLLQESLRTQRARFSVFRPQMQSLAIGTSRPGAKAHQTGSGRLPQRRILWLASSQTYGRLAHKWAVQQAKQAGLNTGGAA
jgi:hypothetical protein